MVAFWANSSRKWYAAHFVLHLLRSRTFIFLSRLWHWGIHSLSGKAFTDLRRFNAKSKTFQFLVREFLFTDDEADDADLAADTEENMQLIMENFSRACFAFGRTINLEKTKVMYTPAVGRVFMLYVEPNITVEGNSLGFR